MKRHLKMKVKMIECLMLAMVLLILSVPLNVSAMELSLKDNNEVETLEMSSLNRECSWVNNTNSRTILHNCLISVYSSSSGMDVAFMTGCSQIASAIGVKDVVIKQKVWYGWKTVATSSGGYNSNDIAYMGEILYTNAIKDETYRITCTHYADADEYIEVHGELEVIFTY